MKITAALDWIWGHATPSLSVPSTVGTKKEQEPPSLSNHKVNIYIYIYSYVDVFSSMVLIYFAVPQSPVIQAVRPVYQNSMLQTLYIEWNQQVSLYTTTP